MMILLLLLPPLLMIIIVTNNNNNNHNHNNNNTTIIMMMIIIFNDNAFPSLFRVGNLIMSKLENSIEFVFHFNNENCIIIMVTVV